jgi:acyl-CoA hydrolase
MAIKSIKVQDTTVQMTELVLPQHTNMLGNLLGGQLMHWIDICAAMSGFKVNKKVCVTASVDKIDFHHPVRLGNVVTLISSVNRVFTTSMEIGVSVFSESFEDVPKLHTNTAYLTFVCMGEDMKPLISNQVVPETEVEIRRFNEALKRRENRICARKPNL